MAGFLFGGNTNLSYDELQQKRKVANALAAQLLGNTPKNTGEGIGAILKGIGVGVANSRTNSAENANRSAASELFNSIIGGTSSAPPNAAQGMQASAATSGVNQEMKASAPVVPGELKSGIAETASALGVSPVDLATAISYETAGTFDPSKRGPRTQWGQHQGLIQFGEPQAQKYGVDWENPVGSQLGPDGAVAKYLRDTGVKPGMGLMDIYSAINAGGVGRYGASDANNGGAPGTVADKVNKQMAGHRAKAMAMFGEQANPAASAIESVSPSAQSSVQPTGQGGFDPSRFGETTALPELSPPREVSNAPQVAQVQDRQQTPPNTPSQQNGVDPRLYQALANPWLNDGQKASIQAVIQQQQQAADRQANEQTWRSRQEYEQSLPENQLDLRIKQTQLEKLSNPGSDESYFGNPVAIQNPDGSVSYGQIGNRGGFKPIQLPEGASFAPPTRTVDAGTETILVDQAGNVISRTPKNNREAARETASGKVEGETTTERQLAASGDAQSAQNALALIENLRNDPAREQATGMSSILNNVPGTAGYDFNAKVEQAKSGAFLTAIQQMKGLGALSNAEGSAATAAITRMKSSLSEEGFLQALNEYETIVRQALQRASSRLPQGQMAPPQPQANKPVSEMTDEELRALANGG